MMKKLAIILTILALSTFFANAAIYEDFEDEAAEFKYPGYSGSTAGISDSAQEFTDAFANDRLDLSKGTPGSFSMLYTWTWDETSTVANGDNGWSPFVRCTAASTRYDIPNTDPAVTDGGLGYYFYLPESVGSMETAMVTREDPSDTGDNETYEQTTWKQIDGAGYWQYIFWNLGSEIEDDPIQSWTINIELGDGVNDCNTETADESKAEAILFRLVPGESNAAVEIYIDDCHDGVEHTPQDTPTPTPTPLAADSVWGLYE